MDPNANKFRPGPSAEELENLRRLSQPLEPLRAEKRNRGERSPFVIAIETRHSKTRFTITERGSGGQRDDLRFISGSHDDCRALVRELTEHLDATEGLRSLEEALALQVARRIGLIE